MKSMKILNHSVIRLLVCLLSLMLDTFGLLRLCRPQLTKLFLFAVLALQDLLDLDRFDDIEWSQESDDEEACEGMDVDS